MRRKEFEISDRAEIDHFLKAPHDGILSLVDLNGRPYGVPLNYGYDGQRFYFHGVKAGRKWEIIRNNPFAHFTVYQPLQYIPSDILGSMDGCDATHFFQSVMAEGRIRVIEDEQEKARGFDILMAHFQKEGTWTKFESHPEQYQSMMKATGLFCLEIEQISAKYKQGQNLKPEKLAEIHAALKSRQEG